MDGLYFSLLAGKDAGLTHAKHMDENNENNMEGAADGMPESPDAAANVPEQQEGGDAVATPMPEGGNDEDGGADAGA